MQQQWPAQQPMQPAMQPYAAQPHMFQPMQAFAQQTWTPTFPMPGPPPQQPPQQPFLAPLPPQQQFQQQFQQPEAAQQVASTAANKAAPWWQNNMPEGGWKSNKTAWKDSWKTEDKNNWKQDDKEGQKKQWWKPAEDAVEPQKFKGKTFHWCPACYRKLYVGMHICLNRDCIHFVVT